MSEVGSKLDGLRRAWWTRPYRIVQTNLRMIDVKRSPTKIVREVKSFGADVIICNVGGIVAFYPTKLPLQWVNPYLQGDFVAAMLKAARAEGLAFVARFDLSKGLAKAYSAYPDWFMKNVRGEPRVYEGTYQACPNGGWGRVYGAKILREALERYDVDGVFFNMSGYPTRDYGAVEHGPCACENCRRKFKEMYGYELPFEAAPSTRAYGEYLEFQALTKREATEANYRVIKEMRPAAAVFGTEEFNEVGRYEVQRRFWRKAPEWAHQSGEQSLLFHSRIPDKPFSSASTAHIDYPWRQVLETGAYHLLRFAQQVATGSYLDLYLMGTFEDQNDSRFVGPIGELFRWFGENAGFYEGQRPAGRIGLYRSGKMDLLGGSLASGRHREEAFRGAYVTLSHARIPFQMIHDSRVGTGSIVLSPERFDAIVISNAALMDDAEAKALDAYVNEGGVVIATGESGAYDARGVPRNANAMRSSPIASFGQAVDAHGWNFDSDKGPVKCGGARIPADGMYYSAVTQNGTEEFLPRSPTQRFGPPEFAFAEPDKPAGTESGILVRRFGKGVSVHLPWLPELQYYRDGLPDLREIIGGLIREYAQPQEVKVVGRGRIEVTVQRKKSGRQRLIHVINYAGQDGGRYEEPARLHEILLGIRGTVDGEVKALVSGTKLASMGPTDADGYCWFTLPPVDTFEVLAASYVPHGGRGLK